MTSGRWDLNISSLTFALCICIYCLFRKYIKPKTTKKLTRFRSWSTVFMVIVFGMLVADEHRILPYYNNSFFPSRRQ